MGSKDLEEKVGMCSKCKEWTAIKDPCCGAPVWFEGELVQPEYEDEDECDKSSS